MGSQGTVLLGAVQVNGGLPPEMVARVVRTRVSAFRMCYERGLLRDPALAGRVVVRFLIGQSGSVNSAVDGGSAIGDASTVACMLSMVRSIQFPIPDGGFATAVLPMTLRSGSGLAVQRWTPPEPSAVHRAADDGWMTKGDDVLAKLRALVDQNPSSRKRYEDLVRGLLARGRFEEALTSARHFVSLDPDLPVARELLAYAAVTNDDPALAVASIDTQTETDPTGVKWHVRGARAYEAIGDERRACAHWRSLAELSPKSDEFSFEAFRCRARVLDDRSVLSEVRALGRPSKLLGELVGQLEAGRPPPFAKVVASAGQFEAEMICSSGERCPMVFVVSPLGNVFSPFTPTDARSSSKSVAFSGLRDGTYMTVLTGGSTDARGEVLLRAYGSTKKLPISRGGRQTVAATRVTIPVAVMRPFVDGFSLAF